MILDMKKFLVIAAAMLLVCISAQAQRESVKYGSAGVITHINDTHDLHPGIGLAYGFRNYNRDAFVSFAYGAEAFGFWLPSASYRSVGIYAIPQIGVAIGPSGFKVYPHTGFMAGYSTDYGRFNTGSNSGIAIEFGEHIGIDFSAYYIFGQAWTTAVNFVWRF